MNIVLCESAEKREYTAGNKARTDTVSILVRTGYKHISLYRSKSAKPSILFQMCRSLIRTLKDAKKNDNVFIQYPYYPVVVNKILLSILSIGRRINGYNISMLIHDSVGLRNEKEDSETLIKEVQLIENADYIICHNEKMSQAFRNAGGNKDYLILGPFDYLYEGPSAQIVYNEKPVICIAGNLSKEKSGYLYKMNSFDGCKFNLYGIGYTGIQSEAIEYKGVFAPEKLIQHLEGMFGLVWDGDSLDTCNGVFGNYLRYNNPHKFSLYLAAGLPVIVWEDSALSSFVRDKEIGICIHSLSDISGINLSYEEYEKMQKNVLSYRDVLVNGRNLQRIIEELKLKNTDR